MADNDVYTVYMHVFPNNKVYIGQTKLKLKQRWGVGGSGYFTGKNGRYWQPLMAYAIKKYGWDNVKHYILARVNTIEEANRLEKDYVMLYNSADKSSGYNMLLGGENYTRNYKRVMSEDARRKMSIAKKGKPIPHLHNKVIYKKISEATKGRVMSLEARKHISESLKGNIPWNKGKKATDLAKLHQSLSHKGYHWYTNGITSVQAIECPDGYYPGRIIKK